jgi:hypothetical protein
MILRWGFPAESPIAAVRSHLDRRGATYILLDQRAVAETRVAVTVGEDVSGTVEMGGSPPVDLGDVRAAYIRPYDAAELATTGPALEHATRTCDLLWSWAEVTPALVVNRPSAVASNGSKPYQQVLIERAGFQTPRTLVTNDPAAAARFWAHHRDVVYKSVSGVRSVVTRLRPADEERLSRITTCPTQFQQYVPGVDVRVHVCREQVFSCSITSDADDYRYGENVRKPFALPGEMSERCRELTWSLGLVLAGIDLRVCPDGTWYCFEVNPAPAFPFFDGPRQPIARAVAAVVHDADRAGPDGSAQPPGCPDTRSARRMATASRAAA